MRNRNRAPRKSLTPSELTAPMADWKRDSRRRLPTARRVGQGGEPVSDLIRLGDLQCLADRQGLSPARFCLRVAAGRPQRIAKIPQRLGLPVAVPQLPKDGEAVLLAGDRPLVAPQPLVGDAEAVQAVGLAVAVAQLPADAEAVLVAGDRLVVAPQPLVDDAEVVLAGGLPAAVAQPPEDGAAVLVAGDRPLVPPQPPVEDAEVVLGVGLGGPIPGAAGKLQGGVVGLQAVLPVATHLEEPEQGL